jgi:hypothetical protein
MRAGYDAALWPLAITRESTIRPYLSPGDPESRLMLDGGVLEFGVNGDPTKATAEIGRKGG